MVADVGEFLGRKIRGARAGPCPPLRVGRKIRDGSRRRRAGAKGAVGSTPIILRDGIKTSTTVSEPMNDSTPHTEKTEAAGEAQLRRIIAAYEARLTELAELAARVRHEINNPLTGLIGQSQLLLREELSSTARRRVQTIEQLANRIRDIVAELRDVQLPKPRPLDESSTEAGDPPRH